MFVVPFESQSWWLIMYVDSLLTIIFVVDFVFRLATAPSKRWYLLHGGGVFDILACLPGLRLFRLFRIVRAMRLVRRLGGPQVFRELRKGLAAGTLYLVIFLGLFTLEFVGLLELHYERTATGGNITTAGDALWWGYVTATTVGYGDRFPVTPGGRVVGVMMLTIGVALFATFSGFLANVFLASKAAPPEQTPPAAGDLEATLRRVEQLHAQQQAELEALRAHIAGLAPPS